VGFSPAKGAGSGHGALHLAVREGDRWEYAGRVGSGFSTGELDRLSEELVDDRRTDPPCSGEIAHPERQTWVEPSAVCEVRFKEWTGAAHLRHPVFLRLRDDKAPEDCIREGGREAEAEPPDPPPPAAAPRTLSLTNLDKPFWPEEGYTKGDLIDYYRKIGPWLLPYLEDRPLVLTRYPDGIHGKSFFQKDAPGYVPDWIRTEMMWSEHAQREIHYFVCDDLDTLVYLINMGTIPLHLWSSRISSLQHPDWSILDLDPKEAPFADVIRIARHIRKLCQSIDLPCFVKTSGSSGLHVLIPLGGQCTYEESRSLAELMARVVATELPEIATIIRSPRSRGGRVYIDYVQNGHGRLLVSPFCVRPLPGATVSAPLRWSEVKKGLTIGRHTIRSVPRRMKRLVDDPLRPVLETRPDLASALELLGRLVADKH
jgi:bifunctional non-homologous end joining protein LigD